jgi:hypothetical protein
VAGAFSDRNVSAYYVILVADLLLAAAYTLAQMRPSLPPLVSGVTLPVVSIAALVFAILNTSAIGISRNRNSIVWLSFTLGLVGWFLSELAWVLYPLILAAPTPTPSIADVFGIGAYGPVLFGLGLQAWPFGENFRTRPILVATLGAIAVGIAVFDALIPSILSMRGGGLSVLVDCTYATLDIVTLIISVPTLLVFRSGTWWRPFLVLSSGLVLALSGHLLTAWTDLNGSYYPGHPLDLLFAWGFLSASLGFYLMWKKTKARAL